MMTCQELSDMISGDRFSRADWKIRLAVRFHSLLCGHCRRYLMQLGAIGAEARRRWSARSIEPSLSPMERRIVQDMLQNASSAASLRGREDDESLPK